MFLRRSRVMNRLLKGVAVGLVVACGALVWATAAQAQVVVYRPIVAAPVPVRTFYAPVAPVTFAQPVPVTTFSAPMVVAPAPVLVPVAPRTVIYRPNPILRPFRFNAVQTW